MVTALACLAYLVTRDSTPESTVQGMIDSLNKHDWKAVFTRFEGAKVDEVVASFDKLMSTQPSAMPKFSLKMTTLAITGDTASGSVSVGFQMGSTPNPTYQEDEVHLHRTSGDWKIVDGKSATGVFTELGKISRDPKMMQQSRDVAQRTVILSNLKQISLGILMYCNDHDDKLSLDQSTLKVRIEPYLKNAKIWIGPDGKPLNVRMNPALVGKPMTSVAEPAITVLLSIGPKDNLQYFDERTPIAFVDGHVKYMTKAALATVKWN